VEIRDAVLEETAELEALQWRASIALDDYREQLLAHPDVIELPSRQVREGLVRVAIGAEGDRLGFSVVLAVADGACEVDGLFVEPDAWRRGVGRALIADAIGRAGAAALEVTANPAALDFYAAVGFHGCGTATTRFGPAARMRRLPFTGGCRPR
jgi:GNAT superfamily N-acetyltransferase